MDWNPDDWKDFNDMINQLRLSGLPLSDHLFMRSDMGEHPNLARLDRVLISEQ